VAFILFCKGIVLGLWVLIFGTALVVFCVRQKNRKAWYGAIAEHYRNGGQYQEKKGMHAPFGDAPPSSNPFATPLPTAVPPNLSPNSSPGPTMVDSTVPYNPNMVHGYSGVPDQYQAQPYQPDAAQYQQQPTQYQPVQYQQQPFGQPQGQAEYDASMLYANSTQPSNLSTRNSPPVPTGTGYVPQVGQL